MTNYELARRWMADNISDYDDGAEINCTRMTEDCADELDIYEDEDYTVPEWLYELAFEIEQYFWDGGDWPDSDPDESEDW